MGRALRRRAARRNCRAARPTGVAARGGGNARRRGTGLIEVREDGVSDSGPSGGGTETRRGMPSARMEALTDGVVASVITVMVIELRVPGDGRAGGAAG